MSLTLACEIAGRAPDEHPFCVAAEVACAGHGRDAFVVALLHDSLEDEYAEYDEICEAFPGHIAEAVAVITRRDDETYAAYIERVCRTGGLALVVKRADAQINLNRCHKDGDANRARRYEQALHILDRSWSLIR